MIPRWLLWTLVALICWGVWAVLSKVIGDQLTPAQIQIFSTVGMIPVMVFLGLSNKIRITAQSRAGVAFAFVSGLLTCFGNVAYYAVLNSAKASTVVPLTALYPLVTIVFAVLFLRERLNRIQLAGIVVSLVAIYFFNVQSESGFLSAWLLAALVPIIFWGLSGFTQKLATLKISGELSTFYFLSAFVAIIPLFLFLGAGPNHDFRSGLSARALGLVTLLGLTLALGNFACLLAFANNGKASIITPLCGLYPVISLPIAIFGFGERPSSREAIGIILALVAVAAISIESKASVPESSSHETKPA